MMTKTPAPAPEASPAQPAVAADPRAALEVAIDAARIADPVIYGPDKRAYAALPRSHTLTELQDRFRLPAWPKESLSFDNRMCLANYINRFSGEHSVIFADYAALTVTARLDWHPHNRSEDAGQARADSHHATLRLQPSEEFARWNGMAGKMHDQADFALFLEENSADIGHPAAAEMIELARDFEATAGHTYKSSVRLDNGDRRMTFETETRAKEEMVIPARFSLYIPVYNGEEPEMLICLFRWRASGGKVQLGFVWHRLEYMRRARFQQIAFAVAESTGCPVFMGRTGP